MKKHTFLMAAAIFFFAFTSACNSSSTTAEEAATGVEQTGLATDSTGMNAQQMAYICPMECEGSASMQPGKCPVCGMDLVKNPKHTASADSTIQQ